MKTANFPEKKRQRQIRALARISPMTRQGVSNASEIDTLTASVEAGSQRGVRSKKNRG